MNSRPCVQETFNLLFLNRRDKASHPSSQINCSGSAYACFLVMPVEVFRVSVTESNGCPIPLLVYIERVLSFIEPYLEENEDMTDRKDNSG